MTQPNPWRQLYDTSLECLRRWAEFSEQYWTPCPDRSALGCFGTGYNNWGVQTNQKYVGAMAVLATARDENPPFSRDRASARAISALRFSLASHHTGDYHCTDGTKWGRTWISGLGIERMMHGVDRIEDLLTTEDRRRLRELLADEANYQISVPVQAGLWNAHYQNKPESNLWNGAICARAATALPDHPHVPQWMEQAHRYFLNGISVPADATDQTLVEGRPIAQWHVGANFFPHYALDHHGYLNVGYMAICLSNVAMLHYAFRTRAQAPPASLYHHAGDLWRLLRRLIFADGRLIRIGGDTRMRFCYCQEYLIPTLVFAADHLGDEHALDLLAGAVDIIRREQALGGDGRFLCRRLDEIRRLSPYYYARLESDRAAVLSMALDWLPRMANSPAPPRQDLESSVIGGWSEPEHGAVLHRCRTRIASWSWRAAEGPQGLCLPPSDGDLAEWKENLGGAVRFFGERGQRPFVNYTIHSFEGGFLTAGEVIDGKVVDLAEGWRGEDSCRHRIVFAALPDGHSSLRMEHATVARRRVFVAGCLGVGLNVPNDMFLKKDSRRYESASGVMVLGPHEGAPNTIDLRSKWVSVDDAIGLVGIYGAESWQILRPGKRSGGWSFGNILSDVLCFGLRVEPFDVFGPAVLLDNGCLIATSVDAAQTRTTAEEDGCMQIGLRSSGEDDPVQCRAVLALGLDGKEYLLVANFGLSEVEAIVDAPNAGWVDLVSSRSVGKDGELCVSIPVGGARLLSTGTPKS